MFTARHAIVVGAFILGVSIIIMISRCYCSTGIDANTADALREIRASLHLYAMRHNGSLPESLTMLAEDIVREGGGTISFVERWEDFLYVGNLTTNDPPLMPVVICAATGSGKRGAVLLLNGSVLLYKDLDQKIVKRIVSEPWELVRQQFKDPRSFDTFRKRIVLHPPVIVQGHSANGKPTPNDAESCADSRIEKHER